MVLSGVDLQRQTLRLYGELVSRGAKAGRGSWSSPAEPGQAATGLPAAVSIAGGTSLLLDPDAAAVKSVFRHGGVDFVVNTLDEALRVLKNEIRKHRPLSVALEGAVRAGNRRDARARRAAGFAGVGGRVGSEWRAAWCRELRLVG